MAENRQKDKDDTLEMITMARVWKLFRDWMNQVSACAGEYRCQELDRLLMYDHEGIYKCPENPKPIHHADKEEMCDDLQWIMDGTFERLQDLMAEIIQSPGMIDMESHCLSDQAHSLLKRVKSTYIKLETFIDLAGQYGIALQPPFVSYKDETPEEKENRHLENLAVYERIGLIKGGSGTDEE